MNNQNILNSILSQAKQSQNKAHNFIAIFDLDSTIFDLSQRQIKIFTEFAKIKEHQKIYPKECQALLLVDKQSMTYYPEDCLRNVGLADISSDFSKYFQDFWTERFFSNKFTKYDIPEPGAKEFIDSLKSFDAHIIYLTGRDIQRMGKGTHSQLIEHEFLDSNHQEHEVYLQLKPDARLLDDIFKSDFILELNPNENEIVFIDNEPKNLVKVAEDHPQVTLVYFDSYHSGQAEVPDKALTISGFM